MPIRPQSIPLSTESIRGYVHKGWALWILALLLAGSLLYGTQRLPLRDYRETRYAELGREILVSGDWVVPHLNGSPYLNKPPLVPWMVALCFEAFGIGEGAARLPSIVAVLWSTLVVGWMTRSIFGRGTGIMGAVLFLGTPGIQYYGRTLMSDTVVTAFILSSVAAFLRGYSRGSMLWYRLGFLACGLGVLAKGLVGVVYPLAALCAFLAMVDRHALRGVPWFSGALIFFAVTAPWFLAVELKIPGFLRHQLLEQQIERLLSGEARAFVALPRWQILLGFAGFLGPLVLVLPWIPGGLSGQEASHRLLWVLGVLVLGSVLLSSGRNHPYTLPAIPPMVSLTAGWLAGVPNRPSPFSNRAAALLIGLLAAGIFASLPWAGGILRGCSPLLDGAALESVARISLGAVATLAFIAGFCLWRGNARMTCLALAALMVPGTWMLVHVQRRMVPLESRAGLARLVALEVPPSWPLVVADPRDRQLEGTGGWGFYARRRVVMVDFQGAAGKKRLQGVSRPEWALDEQTFSALWESERPFCLAATQEALSTLGLRALPSPRAKDGKFGLWMISKSGERPPESFASRLNPPDA